MRHPFAVLLVSAVALVALIGPAPAREVPYVVTVGGRPLDAAHPGARERGGRLFINVVRAVRAFNGLLTFSAGAVRVTVGAQTIFYHVGKTTAEEGEQSITLGAAPFVEDGDTFVPLPSFAELAGSTVTVDRDRHRVDLSPKS